MTCARWLAIARLAAAGCGDNGVSAGEPLGSARDLTIVAHPGDDLVFLEPDAADLATRGVTVVYVAAGEAPGTPDDAERNRAGVKAAYADLAGSSDWRCGTIAIAGHDAEHCRLDAAAISLVFLGYPGGNADGSATESLLHLWQGDIASVATAAEPRATYDRSGLVAAVTEIVATAAPATLRTLDVAHASDDADHAVVGALALVAAAAAPAPPAVIAYRGADVAGEPANADPALYARSLRALALDAACATGCAACGTACTSDALDAARVQALARRYAISAGRGASGELRTGEMCAAATNTAGNPSLTDCTAAPSWQLTAGGQLQAIGGPCLSVIFTGEVVAGACTADPTGRFLLDDEGHLWSGAPPPAQPDLGAAPLYCVGQSGGRPRGGLCGPRRDPPAWELTRSTASTSRASAGITASGRAVRIARLAADPPPRLCAIEPGGLLCAAIGSDGSLAPATRLDSPTAPLAVAPDSLVLGDIDGDARTDACGRDPGGLVCATAASGYRAARWATALAAAHPIDGPSDATDRSLAIAGGRICALAAAGVVCVAAGATAAADPLSTWPDPGAALWFPALDGDAALDWCATTSAGPACSLGRDSALTRDGAPWGYAAGGIVEGSAAEGPVPDAALASFTDIDGDGRDDLCTVQGDVISCARSTGRGFGPRIAYARLPAGMIATALWAEPATVGAPPRLCAGDAAQLACTQ